MISLLHNNLASEQCNSHQKFRRKRQVSDVWTLLKWSNNTFVSPSCSIDRVSHNFTCSILISFRDIFWKESRFHPFHHDGFTCAVATSVVPKNSGLHHPSPWTPQPVSEWASSLHRWLVTPFPPPYVLRGMPSLGFWVSRISSITPTLTKTKFLQFQFDVSSKTCFCFIRISQSTVSTRKISVRFLVGIPATSLCNQRSWNQGHE